MNEILIALGSVVVGFITGALVSRNNAKDTTAIIAAVNSAKDAISAHVTATAPAPKA